LERRPITLNGATENTTQNLSNLSAGSYTLTITDAASCSLAESINITGTNAPVLTETHAQPTCGKNDGAINMMLEAEHHLTFLHGATELPRKTWSIFLPDFIQLILLMRQFVMFRPMYPYHPARGGM